MPLGLPIDYEPRFVDEAVLQAARVRPEGRLFYRERERVYGIADPEARGRAFDALGAAWYERFGLGRPLVAALAAEPLLAGGVGRVAVGRPPHRRDAGAELLVRPGGAGRPAPSDRLLRLLLPPELLLAPERLAPLLARELAHVVDMLDPRFGYVPHLPVSAGGPAERLLRDRYRVVWDTTIDGRLVRAGRLPREAKAARREEFVRTFAALGPGAERAFTRFFLDPAPTHAAILEFVAAGGRAPRTCALCGCPTLDPETELAPAALAAILADVPTWRPADGCCRQCADLYRAAPLSRRAAAALPGIR